MLLVSVLLCALCVYPIHEVRAPLYHSLVDEFLERLLHMAHTEVVEEFVPEARVDEVTGGVFRTAHVEVDVLPVFGSLGREQCLVVVGIHVAQVVGTRPGEARHRAELQREHGFVVDGGIVHHLPLLHVPCPLLGMSQWRLARLGGLIGLHLRQLQRQTFLGNHIRHVVLVVNGERLTPVALAREDGIAQAVVHLHAAESLLRDVFLRGSDGLFHRQAVQRELAIRGVDHDAFLRVEALFRDVGTLDERDDGQVEVLGESIVA